ncbi:MAG: ion transporter [Deltaproteobacteria bacterium]|nr:ion transporter [Deltaproteobacteria bacterium]
MRGKLREKIHTVVFESDTAAGKAFDVALITLILLSVLTVLLESVASLRERYGAALHVLEWTFTIVFTIEYLLRLYCVQRPLAYARSFFGVVDLMACLPMYLNFFIPGAHSLIVVRSLRLLRIFRVFKLSHYFQEGQVIVQALRASRYKILVFLFSILIVVIISGSLMYLVEGPASGFKDIPVSLYWSVVTMTTVGYGDIAPRTPLGQFLASLLMIVGYSIIAVPTGIVTSEFTRLRGITRNACPVCGAEGHDPDALHCKFCGGRL